METAELKRIHEEFEKTASEMKRYVDLKYQEIEKLGKERPETKEAFDKLNAKLDDLETKLNRPGFSQETKTEGPSLEVKAYGVYLRKGESAVQGAEEFKALSTDYDPAAGYLMPVNRQQNVIERLHEFSPIRELASVETITFGDALEVPAEGATDYDAGWVGERQSRPETTAGDIRLERVPVHELYAKPKLTQKQIDDPNYDVEGYVNRKVAQRFGQIEATAFVNGNGVNKPEGLMTHASITSINSGDADEITAAGVVSLFYDLPEYYAKMATWLMRRKTLGTIRQMKEASTGRWLWEPSLAAGQPPTILGQPYREAIDMPLEGTNTFPVLFGNFRLGYQIVDRFDIRVLRDPYSSKPFVEFYTTKRVGAQVVLAEAFRKLKCST